MLPGERLVLASASPRRPQLLAGMGIDFEVDVSDFDEGRLSGLGPRAHAILAARGKAAQVRRRRPDAWVVGVDTVVAVDGLRLGKPTDAGDAARMLRLLSGRAHSVISAVHIASPKGDAGGIATSRVRIKPLSEQEIASYIAGGEGFDKAGAYAIQGKAGRFALLERGRLDTVVGLPTHLLRRLLREHAAEGD
ncbi:MAG: Maf family protein [Candidatus Dormibacteraeota bacterium]|nr:Maf family protein [Candidatus Dormibacteraeota bacterium]